MGRHSRKAKHKNSVYSVAFSPPDGNHVASGSQDATFCIWDIESKELVVGPLAGHEEGVLAVAYSQDGTRLVSGSKDKTVRIWNSEKRSTFNTQRSF